MTGDEFRELYEQARAKFPRRFEQERDAPPSDAEVEAHQAELGVRFPPDYLAFLREYGGGDVGFVGTYSMDRASAMDVVEQNKVKWLGRSDFVAVADNGAGDYYGFRVDDGTCGPEIVMLDHETGEVGRPKAEDFYAFVARYGLKVDTD